MVTCSLSLQNMNVLSCKWIFHIKYNPNGSIERREARFIVRDFGQLAGLDYNETFNPIVKPTIIQIVLSVAITYD